MSHDCNDVQIPKHLATCHSCGKRCILKHILIITPAILNNNVLNQLDTGIT